MFLSLIKRLYDWFNKPAPRSELEQFIIDNEPKTTHDVEAITRRWHERERLIQRMRARGEFITSNWIKDNY